MMKPMDDDGRTIADMDLEGMPWHRKGAWQRPAKAGPPPDLSPEERRAAITGMLKAVCLIAAAYFAGFLVLLLLLDWFWLR
ncbi:MAG: hypothetical protein KBA30_02895 [Clostridia bacterium]|nr:hypothetical protein [Clostridia bacterium]